MEASYQFFLGMDAVGAAVQDCASSMKQADCEIHTCPTSGEIHPCVGVSVFQGGTAQISACTISIEKAETKEPQVAWCCIEVSGVSAQVTGCKPSGAHLSCLTVIGLNACVNENNCSFRIIRTDAAVEQGHLSVVGCKASCNKHNGFVAESCGSALQLTNCSSEKDGIGCRAQGGAKMDGTAVLIMHSKVHGHGVLLSNCSGKVLQGYRCR